jgi:molecular chaperone GrpE (heat shock protein)
MNSLERGRMGWCRPCWRGLVLVAMLGLAGGLGGGVGWCLAGGTGAPLPRFTEEREAAALFFIRKHCPELLPVLERLRSQNRDRYEREIREIFQVTEWLAELADNPRRRELELKIWQTENRAYLLVGKLAGPPEERAKTEEKLLELVSELVELELRILELQVEELERELADTREELNRQHDELDKTIQTRYQRLLDEARKRGR